MRAFIKIDSGILSNRNHPKATDLEQRWTMEAVVEMERSAGRVPADVRDEARRKFLC